MDTKTLVNNRMLHSNDLFAYMQQHGIEGDILHLETPTPTVEIAARVVGAHPDQIVKSILFLVNDQPVLAITCGMAPIDRRAIADLYQVSRKRVKLAPAQAVLDFAGYEVGAMPPFGHLQPLPTLLDRRVLEQDQVYAGGGDENALVRLSPASIERHAHARVVDL